MLTDPPNAFYSVFSFIGFLVAPIPFYWHFRAGDAATCLFMFWASVACLNGFVNSVVWNNSIANSAPVWCDISSRIIIAQNATVAATSLCIMRRIFTQLYNIKRSKRTELIIDLSIGAGIPILQIALSYVVQGHRYDIFEDVGCYPAIVNTPPTYALVFSWPVILSGVSIILNILIFRKQVINHRKDPRNNPLMLPLRDMTSRLLIIAGGAALFTFSYNVHSVFLNRTSATYEKWGSWGAVHSQFSTINQITAADWRADYNTQIALEIARWSSVICGIVFFLLFGLGWEAPREYRKIWEAVRSRVRGDPVADSEKSLESGRRETFSDSSSTKSTTLPIPVVSEVRY
ncbi:fungal pheromone STE3G-protein-coupled receptor [Artomyces pyxidatus]|uniref:Fungal pheromone STE3G-protein-coupled receptor n=1 Tax=Artomyces pyxidatus TaxID=48021 RepID=A0ACB8SZN5_9AGAM|nr:fungal pheromone STE3G-protein-coupled receptor [Artomyces pyxidatus]